MKQNDTFHSNFERKLGLEIVCKALVTAILNMSLNLITYWVQINAD